MEHEEITHSSDMLKAHIVSCSDEEMSPVAVRTYPLMKSYAQRHGFYFSGVQGHLVATRHPSWNKMAVMIGVLLSTDADWVVWFDADVLVMNETVHVADIVARAPAAAEAIFASDDNGLCAGVFMLKRTAWATEFARTVCHLGDARNEHLYGIGLRAEQNCIKAIMRNFFSCDNRLAVVEQRVMNAYTQHYQPGDWLIHLASHLNEQRISFIDEFLPLRIT